MTHRVNSAVSRNSRFSAATETTKMPDPEIICEEEARTREVVDSNGRGGGIRTPDPLLPKNRPTAGMG
jgi:hypothetical protein